MCSRSTPSPPSPTHAVARGPAPGAGAAQLREHLLKPDVTIGDGDPRHQPRVGKTNQDDEAKGRAVREGGSPGCPPDAAGHPEPGTEARATICRESGTLGLIAAPVRVDRMTVHRQQGRLASTSGRAGSAIRERP